MKNLKLLNPNFTDIRGTITDIFSNDPKQHCSIIESHDNAIRANHYHKETIQYTYIVEGRLRMASVTVNDIGIYSAEDIVITTLELGSLVTHQPFEAHAFKSIGRSLILAFACGIRGGDKYEADVYRLKDSLF